MPTNEVKIKVTADTTDANRKLGAVKVNLREVGERISGLGRMMTMSVTAPIVGGFGAIVLAGKNASEEIQKMGVGNVPEEVARLGQSYDELMKATAPLKTELQGLAADVLPIIADLLGDISPLISDMVGFIRDMVAAFKELDPGAQTFILALGGIVLAAGPMVTIIGEVVKVIGTINQLLPLMNTFLGANAVVTWAAVGPWIALAGAIGLVVKVIADNWSTMAKASAILNYMIFGKVPDWITNAATKGDNGLLSVGNLTAPGKNAGQIAPMLGGVPAGSLGKNIPVAQYGAPKPIPAVPQTQNNNVTINTTINTPVNLATAQQAENVLLPYIFRGLHQAGIATGR